LTVFLDGPKGSRSSAAPTFPAGGRGHGLPAFRQVLVSVSEPLTANGGPTWRGEPRCWSRRSRQAALVRGRPDEPLTESLLFDGRCAPGSRSSLTPEWGGFGSAPKFPSPPRRWSCCCRRGGPEAPPFRTLDANGPAGGHVRPRRRPASTAISVDDPLASLPHFEKDALRQTRCSSPAYLHGLASSPARRGTAGVIEQTFEYALREPCGFPGRRLRVPSQDADTDGRRGVDVHLGARRRARRRSCSSRSKKGASSCRGELGRGKRGAAACSRSASERAAAGPRRQGDRLLERPDGWRRSPRAGRRLEPGPTGLEEGRGAGGVSCSGRSRPRAASTGAGAPAGRAARDSSTTTPTSRTASTSCTSRPASCGGSRSRGASRCWRSSSSGRRTWQGGFPFPRARRGASSWSHARRS